MSFANANKACASDRRDIFMCRVDMNEDMEFVPVFNSQRMLRAHVVETHVARIDDAGVQHSSTAAGHELRLKSLHISEMEKTKNEIISCGLFDHTKVNMYVCVSQFLFACAPVRECILRCNGRLCTFRELE